MRIINIGGIILDNIMWSDEALDSDGVKAEVVNNLDGGVIIFEQLRRASSQNITLLSKEDGWMSKVTLDGLLALSNNSFGTIVVIEDDDGVQLNTRFRHEQTGGAVQFDRLVDSKATDWYVGTIYLAKV